MPVSATAVLAMILATAFSAGLSALGVWSRRRLGVDAPSPWWGALAVGLGYLIGHAGVATPAIPPADVTDRIPLIALVGSGVAALLAGGRRDVWIRVLAYTGLATLTYVVMLGPVLGSGDFPGETVTWLVGSAVVSVLAALNVGFLDAPGRRSETWVGLAAFAFGAGVVLVLSNSAVLFQLGGVLAVALVASIVGAWGRPVGGGVPVALGVLTALIVEGFVYAFLPAPSAAILAASPLVLWLTRLRPIARLGPRTRAAIAAVLILIPVAVAAALVLASKSDEGYGY